MEINREQLLYTFSEDGLEIRLNNDFVTAAIIRLHAEFERILWTSLSNDQLETALMIILDIFEERKNK